MRTETSEIRRIPQCLARFAAVLAVVLLAPFGANAATPLHLQWESLPSLVGKTIRIAMPGGTITGKAVGVEADALLVNVKSTSDAKSYPKGVTRVPRTTLHFFEMRTKSKGYRIACTTLFSLVGLVGGAAAAWRIDFFGSAPHSQATAAFLGIWGGATAGGYVLGNALDKGWTPVEIAQ